MRILFTTVGLPGHFFPLVPLAWAARAIGHDVLVVAPEEFTAVVTGSGLPVASSGPGARFADLVADDRPAEGLAEQRLAHGRAFGRMAAGALWGTTSLVRAWRPDLVVSERAEFAGVLAAFTAGVPQVELHWGVAPLTEYREGASAELAQPLANRGLDVLPAPAAVLNPWPRPLRLPHAAAHLGISPHPQFNGPARVPDWVMRKRSRPRVCLTLGTVVPRSGSSQVADSVIDIITALSEVDCETVVAVSDRIAAGWPPLPDSVRHVGHMPLAEVFGNCDAAIHHGGQGTALTALAAGLPQLVLPVFDDQFDNADAIVRAGAGVRLSPAEITPDTVAGHCADLLRRPAFRAGAAEVAALIRTMPSPVEAARALEDVLDSARGLAA